MWNTVSFQTGAHHCKDILFAIFGWYWGMNRVLWCCRSFGASIFGWGYFDYVRFHRFCFDFCVLFLGSFDLRFSFCFLCVCLLSLEVLSPSGTVWVPLPGLERVGAISKPGGCTARKAWFTALASVVSSLRLWPGTAWVWGHCEVSEAVMGLCLVGSPASWAMGSGFSALSLLGGNDGAAVELGDRQSATGMTSEDDEGSCFVRPRFVDRY